MVDLDDYLQIELDTLVRRAGKSRDILVQAALRPNERKERVKFSAARAAELLGRTSASVGRVAKEHGYDRSQPDERARGRFEIPQEGFDKLLDHYDLKPETTLGDALVVAYANQKGGVGKTTTTVDSAHYLALMGLKVAVLDADSQASFTTFMGFMPDVDLTEDDTISPIITGRVKDDGSPYRLEDLVRPAPHLDRLSFVPSCLELANGDVGAYERQFMKDAGDSFSFYRGLRDAIESFRKEYDVILIDCPPHISAISYNCAYAADEMIIPLGANMLDISSTIRYIEWLELISQKIPDFHVPKIRFLITDHDSSSASSENASIIRKIFGDHVMRNTALHSSEIQRAGAIFQSIYEVDRAIGSASAWSRACKSADAVNQEIYMNIQHAMKSRGTLKTVVEIK